MRGLARRDHRVADGQLVAVARLAQRRDERAHGREAAVAGIALEGEAEQGDLGVLGRDPLGLQEGVDPAEDMDRHRVVHLARGAGDLQLDPGAPAEGVDEPRILGQAVAAHPVGGMQDVDVVLALLEGVRAADHLHHVDGVGQGVRQLRQLVGQRHVEVDPEVVGELDHLGRFRRGQRHHVDRRDGLAPEVGAGLAGFRVHAADQDRDRLQVADRLALGQPLGAEGHVDMGPRRENLVMHQPRGAGGHGALDHDELAVGHIGRDGAAGGADMAQIRLELVRERRAHGDQDRLDPLGRGRVGRARELAGFDAGGHQILEAGFGDRALALVQGGDHLGVGVDADHAQPAGGEHGGDDAADVAEADDGDVRDGGFRRGGGHGRPPAQRRWDSGRAGGRRRVADMRTHLIY